MLEPKHHVFEVAPPYLQAAALILAGFRNRKFFVLFVLYSAAFCTMGAAHSWYELLVLAPARLGHSPRLGSATGWAESSLEHDGTRSLAHAHDICTCTCV